MTKRHVYIDYNATTPLGADVKAGMVSSLDVFGNASSLHGSDRLAHGLVEEARSSVAKLLGAKPGEIVFTSGGSESNNTVFQTMHSLASGQGNGLPATGRTEIITTAIEHPCVLNSAKHLQSLGFKVTFLPVDQYGKADLDALIAALSEKTLFVSVMMANNEIGTIQDIAEIRDITKKAGAYLHTDAFRLWGRFRWI